MAQDWPLNKLEFYANLLKAKRWCGGGGLSALQENPRIVGQRNQPCQKVSGEGKGKCPREGLPVAVHWWARTVAGCLLWKEVEETSKTHAASDALEAQQGRHFLHVEVLGRVCDNNKTDLERGSVPGTLVWELMEQRFGCPSEHGEGE